MEMPSMNTLQWLQAFTAANPVFLAVALGLAIATIVLAAAAVMMKRAGMSLRPIAFFALFMGVIVGPQVLGHLVLAVRPAFSESAAGATAAAVPPLAVRENRYAHPRSLFGADVQTDLIQDAKPIFGEFLGAAEHAELAIFASAETVLAATFTNAAEADRAMQGYARFFGVDFDAAPTGELRGSRPGLNDRVGAARFGANLLVWTAPTDAVLTARRQAIGVIPDGSIAAPVAAVLDEAPTPEYLLPFAPAVIRLFEPWPAKVAGLATMMLLAALVFFKGAAWASRAQSTADRTARPLPLAALRDRLLAVNGLDAPVQVTAAPGGRRLRIDWRYADAKWMDHARAHGMRRSHRLDLDLEEASHTARVIEYWGAMDWSAGRGGGQIKWQAARGIRFFEYAHERVFGLQFGPDGRPSGALGYAYTFDLRELKQPFIRAVTDAGWTWQPLMVDVPKALRWLTE
jgi:hypothetical protein